MLKIEYVWRELLYRAIEQRNPYFSIIQLSNLFKLSTSVVSHAILPLKGLGVVKIAKKRSKIADIERLLLFWATRRNLQKDILYQTYSSLPLLEKESSMPANVFPTAYTAYRFLYDDIPSDYEDSYFYTGDIQPIIKRFPPNSKKSPNIIILRQDPYLPGYKQIPLAQIFADLWNLPDWYAKEFSDALLAKIRERVGL